MEIIKRKNAIGKNFEDSGNLLKQKRRPKQDLDTSKLDPFIDDEPVVKQQPAAEPKPVRPHPAADIMRTLSSLLAARMESDLEPGAISTRKEEGTMLMKK